MISMRDYAKEKHISYEAVRKQVVRYQKELEGHIFKQGRTQYLDEYAVEFLSEKRATNPIIIYEANKDEEIERLKNENDSYLKKIAILQEQLLQQKDQMISLEVAQQAAEKETKLLEGFIQDAKAEIQTVTEEKQEQERIRKELEAELEAERHRKLTFSERLFGRKK